MRASSALAGQLGVDEHQGAVFLLKVGAEGGFQHGLGESVPAGLDLGDGGIPELLLRVVELVPGVDAVADAGQGGLGVDVLFQRFLVQEGSAGGSIVPGGGQTAGQLVVLFFQRRQVGALIGHFGKSHIGFSFACKSFK